MDFTYARQSLNSDLVSSTRALMILARINLFRLHLLSSVIFVFTVLFLRFHSKVELGEILLFLYTVVEPGSLLAA